MQNLKEQEKDIMKKLYILTAVFAGMTTAASTAKAGEVMMDFDNPARESVNAHITDKISVYESDVPNAPKPQFAAELAGSEAVNPYTNCLILAKDILKELLPVERIGFMSGVSLENGKVFSRDHAVLWRTGLPASSVDAITKAFAYPTERNPNQPVIQRPAAELGELLQGLPEDVKGDFLDNLKFLDGDVVSAKTDLLEKSVTPEKFKEILNTIMPATTAVKDTKAIKKDHACNASTGAKRQKCPYRL